MAVIEIAKIQVRRGQEHATGIPQLAPGEFGWAQDTENLYIGKRIAEGANTDENSRILTQKDYDNLFAIAMGAGRESVASTSSYRYRDNLEFSLFKSTTTTIGKKLDAFVSITDFGVTASSTATDIYQKLSLAIENLYSNDYFGPETRRKLLIPAGNYYLSDTVDLPPYSCLIGEGPGITNIIPLNNDKPLFRTVDGNGIDFESTMAEQQSQAGSKFVCLKDMTLAYTTSTSTIAPLISLDNTENSVIDNVEFTIVNVLNTSTGTILIHTSTIHGTGLSLRGERRSGIEQNKNVSILNSTFKNIGLGILGTGTVAYSKIENCHFSELTQAVKFLSFDGDVFRPAPTNALITKNNFEYIRNQAIYIGVSTNQSNFTPNILNHSSSFNNFYNVGNGDDFGDGIVTNTGTAIISAYGEGFNSINDRFSRREYANPNVRPGVFNFFYKPLIEGNGSINAGTNLEVRGLTFGKQFIDRLYVSDDPVSYKIPYIMQDGDNKYSRSGELTVTVCSNPNYALTPVGSISDYYDFSFDPLWPPATTATNYDLSGNVIQPSLTLEAPPTNNSYLFLVYNYPIAPVEGVTTFIGTITNITNANPAVVTTQDAHGLSSGTQILLEGVLGMSNFFSSSGSKEFYAGVLSTNTFELYWDSSRETALDTTSLAPYNPASSATVITIAQNSQLELQYQLNLIA